MSDPTGGAVARITLDMLKRVAVAASRSPQAVATTVNAIAAELGTSTAAVVRGIAVLTERVSTTAATAGWAGTATTAVEGAMAKGALVTSEAVVAGTTAAASSGGAVTAAVTWFGGLTVAAKVAIVAAAIGGTVLVARGAGWLASDSPSAVSGAGPGTSAEFGETIPDFNEGYQAVGVYFEGNLKIVSVRGTDDVTEGIAPCHFRHGGIDCDADADVRPLVADVFPDAAAATNALCGLLGGAYYEPALADGWVAPYGEGTVTLDDWGAVDFAECDKALAGG